MMTKKNQKIWHNGSLVPWENATVHITAHALHYGSSVFEGIRAYETPHGTKIFRLQAHVQRLLNSARIYRIKSAYSVSELAQACKEVVQVNGLRSAYIRPIIFMGAGSLGIVPHPDVRVETAVLAMEWGPYLGADALALGVDACVSSWTRLAPNTMPTMAKAGGNYLSSLLIAGEARRHGYVEAIALDHRGFVSEGPGENLFLVAQGVLYTPPLTASILPGITRDTIIHLARDLGLVVREEDICREALYLADEVFFTGTAAEISPVRSIDQIPVGSGKRGPITAQLQEAFFGLFNGKTPDRWGWLDAVS